MGLIEAIILAGFGYSIEKGKRKVSNSTLSFQVGHLGSRGASSTRRLEIGWEESIRVWWVQGGR